MQEEQYALWLADAEHEADCPHSTSDWPKGKMEASDKMRASDDQPKTPMLREVTGKVAADENPAFEARDPEANGLDAERELVKLTSGPLALLVRTTSPGEVAHVQVDVRVGDDNERERAERESAHLIEHLVASLLRSRAWPSGDAKRELEEMGVRSNACTSDVRTSFFMTGLDADLETMLAVQLGALTDFEAMFVGDADPRFGREVTAVREELKAKLSDPDYQLYEAWRAIVYAGHPRATSQAFDDLAVAERRGADVLAFFRRFYHRDNMLVTVVSTRPREQVLALLGAFRFPARAEPTPARSALANTWRARVNVAFAAQATSSTERLLFAWPLGLTEFDERRAAIRALVHLLSGGFSSRLLERLRVKEGLVYSVSAATLVDERDAAFSVFAISTTCSANALARVAAAIVEEMRSLARDGPTPVELVKWQRTITSEREFTSLSRHPQRYASEYSEEVLFRGALGPTIDAKLAALSAVSAEQVRARCAALIAAPLLVVHAGKADMSGELRAAVQ